MKKVTMTFIVDNQTADKALNLMAYGEMGDAAYLLNQNCQESDYDIEDDVEY